MSFPESSLAREPGRVGNGHKAKPDTAESEDKCHVKWFSRDQSLFILLP